MHVTYRCGIVDVRDYAEIYALCVYTYMNMYMYIMYTNSI